MVVVARRRKSKIELAQKRRESLKKRQLRLSLARTFKIRQKRIKKEPIRRKPYEIRKRGSVKFRKRPIFVNVSDRIRSRPYWHTQRRKVKVVYVVYWVYKDEFRRTVREGEPFYISMFMRTSETRAYELAQRHIPNVEQLFMERNPQAVVLNISIVSITVGKKIKTPYRIPELHKKNIIGNRRQLRKKLREMS